MLQNHGYIYRELGRNTFVTPPKLQNSLHVLTSFSDDMKERGLKPSHKILSLKDASHPKTCWCTRASRNLRKNSYA